jgi:hypothetical protein
MATLFMGFLRTRSSKELLLVILVKLRHNHGLWWALLVKKCVFSDTEQQYLWLRVNLTRSTTPNDH